MVRKCCFVMLSIFLGVYGATPQVSCCQLKSMSFVVVRNVLQLKFCLTSFNQTFLSSGRCIVHGVVGCSFTAAAVPTILTRRTQSAGKHWTAHVFVATTGSLAVQCGGQNRQQHAGPIFHYCFDYCHVCVVDRIFLVDGTRYHAKFTRHNWLCWQRRTPQQTMLW